MSIASMVYLRCDVCGNPYGGTGDMGDRADEVRVRARRDGWIRRPPQDGDEFFRDRHGARLSDVCTDCQGDR